MALWWLWVALPRLSRLDVGRSMFDVRCSGPRTVPVHNGSELAWVSDLLATYCPRGRCEPGRFAVRRQQVRAFNLPERVGEWEPELQHWAGLIASGRAHDFKETALLPDFLTDIFCGLLGY